VEGTEMIGHRPTGGVLSSGKVLVTYRNVGGAPSPPPWSDAYAQVGGRHHIALDPTIITSTYAWLGDAYDKVPGKMLELDYDSSRILGDYGYSGWVQFPDEEIFCVYHHRGSAPKSYMKGCWFREEDF